MSRRRLTVLASAAALALLASRSQAQEPIDVLVVEGQPVSFFFPNVVDPDHPKALTFDALATNVKRERESELTGYFDWVDPAGTTYTSPEFSFPLDPLQTISLLETWTIPYCPPQVSLHLSVEGAPVEVHGVFTHECLVPEPSTWLLGVTGLASMLLFGRRRRVASIEAAARGQ